MPEEKRADNRKLFVRQAETNWLIEDLREVDVGEFRSYADLSKAAGIPVDGSSCYLQSARRVLQSEDRIIFRVIRGKGLRRCSDEEKVELGRNDIGGLRRKARKVMDRTLCVDSENLSRDDSCMLRSIQSTVRMISHCSRTKEVKALATTISEKEDVRELKMNEMASRLMLSVTNGKKKRQEGSDA